MIKPLMLIIFFCTALLSGCANDKNTGAPTPAYATYYFPVFYPAYTYAPFYDQYYNPGPHNDNFNYYGYYAYWGSHYKKE